MVAVAEAEAVIEHVQTLAYDVADLSYVCELVEQWLRVLIN